MEYAGKNVIITGGSRGIGLALAKEFARQGADVTIAARDANRISQAIASILEAAQNKAQTVSGLVLDVTSDRDVSKCFAVWMTKNGAPDVLVNSAGYARPGHVEELSLDVFRQTMDVNYFGTVNCVKAVLPAMLNRGKGLIVNISSMGGFLGIYGYTAYSGSKYAVTGFSDVLRNELKPKGIQVAVVFPPDTDTEQLAYESQFKPAVTRKIAGTAGLMKPEEVASGIIKGINRNQYVITPGFESTLIYWLHHFIGRLTFTILDWMSVNAWKKEHSTGKGSGSG